MRKLLITSVLLAGTLLEITAQVNERCLDYVTTYAPLAIAQMHQSRIPASITLAQGILESGAGSSSLARESNNHFGIKCNNGWSGRTHHAEDDDYNGGRLIASCFRAYDDPAQSYADHAAFLSGSPRYASLFTLELNDYRAWAKGLKSAGYATSSTYAHKLIDIIELYELYQYDSGVAGLPLANNSPAQGPAKESRFGRPVLTGARMPSEASFGASRQEAKTKSTRILSVNDVNYVVAWEDETVLDLATRAGYRASEVMKYNEELQSENTRLADGSRVFMQPKRTNYRGKTKTHRVRAEETMQDIADLYGLSTASLYQKNNLRDGLEPRKGEEIVIRGSRSSKDIVQTAPKTQTRSKLAERPSTQPLKRESSSATSFQGSAAVTASTNSELMVPEIITLPPVQGSQSAAPVPKQNAELSKTQNLRASSNMVTVNSGDTLFSISRRTGVSVAEIRALNGLDGNTIHAGQQLLIAR